LKSACIELNADNPTERHRRGLEGALNRTIGTQFTEKAFVGTVNCIRLKHPHVTKVFANMWVCLARATTRGQGRYRYPGNVAKVKDCFDEALVFKISEEDFEDPEFDECAWITNWSQAIDQVLDMRAVNVIFAPESDWTRILTMVHKLEAGSNFAKILLKKIRKKAMQQCLITRIGELFEDTLQSYVKMNVERNLEARNKLVQEFDESGITEGLKGSRETTIVFGGIECFHNVKSVPDEVDLRWEGLVRDAGRSSSHAVDFEVELETVQRNPHPFCELVGREVLADSNKSHEKLNRHVKQERFVTGVALLEKARRYYGECSGVDPYVDLEYKFMEAISGTSGKAAVEQLALQTMPTAKKPRTPVQVYDRLSKLQERVIVRMAGETAHGSVQTAMDLVKKLIDLEVPSLKERTGSAFVRNISATFEFFVVFPDTSTEPPTVFFGSVAMKKLLEQMWSNMECPESPPSRADLDACGPYKFLMDDDDHDMMARIQAGIEENQRRAGLTLPKKPPTRIVKKAPPVAAVRSKAASSSSGRKVNAPPAKTNEDKARSYFD